MRGIGQDLRCALRGLKKNPGFTAIAVLTLALGIGANTAMFSVLNAVLLRPLPYPHHERIVQIWATNPGRGLTRAPVSLADFLDWREQNQSFERLTAARFWFYTVGRQGTPEQLHGMRVSPDFFSVLGVQPVLGRTFRPEEEQPGRDRVVILTHGLWQRRFAANPALIGRTISIDAEPFTVIGILPADFWFYPILGRAVEIWMPFAFGSSELRRDSRSVIVHGRLKPSVRIEQARLDIATIARNLERKYPAENKGWSTRIDPGILSKEDIQPKILLLFAAVGFVLLIACGNVASLTLARAMQRGDEIALRAALGASRATLIRQLLVEGTVLGGLGCAAGLVLGILWLRILVTFVPTRLEAFFSGGLENLQLDASVLTFSVGASLLSGVLSGLFPAVHASRPRLGDALSSAGNRNASGAVRGRRKADWLLVPQVALAVMLSIGAGLMIRSLGELQRFDRGLKTANVLTAQIRPPENKYKDSHEIASFHRRVIERLETLPEAVSTSAISFLHLSESGVGCTFTIEGRSAPFPGDKPNALYYVVAPGYLRTMEIPLLTGRHLSSGDAARAPAVAVIDEKLAKRYWPREDPIGRRFKFDPIDSENPSHASLTADWITVVGVAGTVLGDGLWEHGAPVMYLPYQQNPARTMHLVVRTDGNPLRLANAVQSRVWEVDPDQPVSFVRTMEEVSAWAFAERRLTMQLLTVFAILATLLSAAGIYGMVSYTVSQRTHEFGIRMALGAQRHQVLSIVLRHALALTAISILIGLGSSAVLIRYLEAMLFGVSPHDASTFVVVSVVFGAVIFVASYVPARRATRVDPLVALRYE